MIIKANESQIVVSEVKSFAKFRGYILKIQVNTPPRDGLGLSGSEAVGAILCTAVDFDLDMS